MIGSLTVPFLAVLMALSGIPGLKGLPFFGGKHRQEARAQAAAADTLPPLWKHAARLAPEHSLVSAGMRPIGLPYQIRLQTAYDPRKLRIDVDPAEGRYMSSVEIGDVELGTGTRQPLEQQAHASVSQSFADAWRDRSRRDVNTLGTNTPLAHTVLSLPIPGQFPHAVASVPGP